MENRENEKEKILKWKEDFLEFIPFMTPIAIINFIMQGVNLVNALLMVLVVAVIFVFYEVLLICYRFIDRRVKRAQK